MRYILLCGLFLSGCTIDLNDRRMPPEVVAQQFELHSQAIVAIDNRLKAVEEKVSK